MEEGEYGEEREREKKRERERKRESKRQEEECLVVFQDLRVTQKQNWGK